MCGTLKSDADSGRGKVQCLEAELTEVKAARDEVTKQAHNMRIQLDKVNITLYIAF